MEQSQNPVAVEENKVPLPIMNLSELMKDAIIERLGFSAQWQLFQTSMDMQNRLKEPLKKNFSVKCDQLDQKMAYNSSQITKMMKIVEPHLLYSKRYLKQCPIRVDPDVFQKTSEEY